jgi:hypothetical protein
MNLRRHLFWGTVPVALGIVSLVGTILTIAALRTLSQRWYLGIPQAILLGVLAGIGPIADILGIRITDFMSVALYLLSFCSVCFFLSFPGTVKKTTLPCALVAGLISLFALVGLNSSIGGILHPLQTSWNVVGLFDGLYMLFLMPVIGLCYVFTAYKIRE